MNVSPNLTKSIYFDNYVEVIYPLDLDKVVFDDKLKKELKDFFDKYSVIG